MDKQSMEIAQLLEQKEKDDLRLENISKLWKEATAAGEEMVAKTDEFIERLQKDKRDTEAEAKKADQRALDIQATLDAVRSELKVENERVSRLTNRVHEVEDRAVCIQLDARGKEDELRAQLCAATAESETLKTDLEDETKKTQMFIDLHDTALSQLQAQGMQLAAAQAQIRMVGYVPTGPTGPESPAIYID